MEELSKHDHKDDYLPSPKRPCLVDEEEEEVKEKDAVAMEMQDTKNFENEGVFLMEKDVGITEYVNEEHSRFFAILKQRYSDFIVHEVTPTGDIVRLTTFDLPDSTHDEGLNKTLDMLITEDDLQKLQELAESDDQSHHIELQVSSASKESRTLIHKGIRKKFPNLDSRTITENEKTVIRVFLRSKGLSNRSNWPRHYGDYVKCVLFKENKDTMQAINILAKMLRVKPSIFQYAGTKDKRAITSQHITIYRVSPERLLTVNGANTGIKLGNFQYCKLSLKLGEIKGNHFTVVLRDVRDERGDGQSYCGLEERVKDTMESLKQKGFLNYFGMQRFGTSIIPTHHIGRALLHSDWQEAINLILKPREGEPLDIHVIREYYQETKDVTGTLDKLSSQKHNTIEVQLLKGLEKHGPSNLLGALYFIPRNTRMMYVHSYQSYVWNRIASFRFRNGGLKPIPGDLVYKKSCDEQESVQFITDDNCSSYTIYDVILPLPGYSVKYPNNTVGEEYLRILAEDNLSPEKLLHRVKDFALPGGYRYLITKLENLEWELLQYDDVTIPLIQSDWDVLVGNIPPPTSPSGSKTALILKFSLPSSTYATMALREILKHDTSSHFQTQLNQLSDNTRLQENDDKGSCF